MQNRSMPRRSDRPAPRPQARHAVAVVALLLGSTRLVAAEPVLSEFLALNKQTLRDEDGDASDWIEIYNPNAAAVRLDGYYLTDQPAKPTKWRFPDVTLAGNAYLLVWASEKNRTDPAKPLHANFKLAESGEYLALIKPDGVTVASDFGKAFPPQTADVAYGIAPGGGANAYLVPTPGGPNRLASVVTPVQCDHARGLFTDPFDLTLSTATAGASIRYTTDGSMPTATTGTPYAGPIRIDNTTVVHAIACKAGATPAPVLAESYIFPARVLRQPTTLPGYSNPKEPINNPGPHEVDVPLGYGMNPDVVNDPQLARQALDGLSQIPTLSIGVDPARIFGPTGFYDTPQREKGEKIPVSFEFIDPAKPQNNVAVGAAITAHAKQKLKRSFHLHFGSKYGASKLNASVFDTAPFGGSGATHVFDDLILRAGNNRSWATTAAPIKTTYTEDEFVRDTQIAMTGAGVHGTFVHLYFNGIYWGLYNLVERPDDGYGAAYFGTKKADYFSISQKGVISGDDARWKYLTETLVKRDLSVPANYAEVQTDLDVTQFADYVIGQWFCGVSDWPDTNFWAGGDTHTKQPFRFYAWDGEEMMDTVDRFPTVPHGPWVNPAFAKKPINNRGPVVRLWTALKKSPQFMALFAGEVRKNVTGNGPLTDDNALARWNALNDSIRDAIVDESARWGSALNATGRHTYTKPGDWVPATQEVAGDLQDADAKFIAALRAEGYYP